MAYTLTIARSSGPIPLSEWTSAASRIAHARIQTGNIEIVNPSTEERIRLMCGAGDLEVLAEHGWRAAIRFSHGAGTFNATDEIDSPSNPVRQVARALAKELDAVITGEEGEEYVW